MLKDVKRVGRVRYAIYLCIQNINRFNGSLDLETWNNSEYFVYLRHNRTLMAVYLKAIPTLRGEVAARFIKVSEDNLRRSASIDFTKQAANSHAILEKNASRR